MKTKIIMFTSILLPILMITGCNNKDEDKYWQGYRDGFQSGINIQRVLDFNNVPYRVDVSDKSTISALQDEVTAWKKAAIFWCENSRFWQREYTRRYGIYPGNISWDDNLWVTENSTWIYKE